MKKSVKTTGKEFADRRASLLKKIHYDPKKSVSAWNSLLGIWESRIDVDATTIRTEAWGYQK